MSTVRKLLDDQTFPNEWKKGEEHAGHAVLKKEGVSKSYGVHGIAVGVDFDICIADGVCISVCPVNVFEKFEVDGEKQRKESGELNDSGQKLLDTWKADPVNESACIFCRACEIQCPVQAIKITEGVGPFG